jgi:hypothetical protein
MGTAYLDLTHAPAYDLLQHVKLSQMLEHVHATWPNQQLPDRLAEQVTDHSPKAWLLIYRIEGHMGFHFRNRVEVVIAQATEPVLDNRVNCVGIGKDVFRCDAASSACVKCSTAARGAYKLIVLSPARCPYSTAFDQTSPS